MKADLLLKLADFLDTLPDDQFDICQWTNNELGDGYYGPPSMDQTGPACGTAGCSLGWACTMEEFKSLGLFMNIYGDPEYKGNTTYRAAADLFEIELPDAHYLFCPSISKWDGCLPDDATGKDAAEHIRKFVKEFAGHYAAQGGKTNE